MGMWSLSFSKHLIVCTCSCSCTVLVVMGNDKMPVMRPNKERDTGAVPLPLTL